MMLDAASQTVACPAIPHQPGDVQSQQRMKEALFVPCLQGPPCPTPPGVHREAPSAL